MFFLGQHSAVRRIVFAAIELNLLVLEESSVVLKGVFQGSLKIHGLPAESQADVMTTWSYHQGVKDGRSTCEEAVTETYRHCKTPSCRFRDRGPVSLHLHRSARGRSKPLQVFWQPWGFLAWRTKMRDRDPTWCPPLVGENWSSLKVGNYRKPAYKMGNFGNNLRQWGWIRWCFPDTRWEAMLRSPSWYVHGSRNLGSSLQDSCWHSVLLFSYLRITPKCSDIFGAVKKVNQTWLVSVTQSFWKPPPIDCHHQMFPGTTLVAWRLPWPPSSPRWEVVDITYVVWIAEWKTAVVTPFCRPLALLFA